MGDKLLVLNQRGIKRLCKTGQLPPDCFKPVFGHNGLPASAKHDPLVNASDDRKRLSSWSARGAFESASHSLTVRSPAPVQDMMVLMDELPASSSFKASEIALVNSWACFWRVSRAGNFPPFLATLRPSVAQTFNLPVCSVRPSKGRQ